MKRIALLALVGALAIAAFIISFRNAERINSALERLSDRIVRVLKRKKNSVDAEKK